MKVLFHSVIYWLISSAITLAFAEKLTIAAASDLKFAFQEIVTDVKRANPNDEVEVIIGSSGKFFTQIQNGAPFDLFFSADVGYPNQLKQDGLTSSEVSLYALGRIVLWSGQVDASQLTLKDLTRDEFHHIAIANPKHAPYGKRAEEALSHLQVLEAIRTKLVIGENIAQAAQYVVTGNADIGIIAYSLALSPELSAKGNYALIPDTLH